MKPLLALCFAAFCCGPAQCAPTFNHDVAPIIYQNCASCHRPGGSASFALLSYPDAKRHATEIAALTKSRYMPPWLPEPGYGDFQDARRLSDAQIRLISEWVSAGAPEGAASDAPQPPSYPDGWQLGPPDLIVDDEQPLAVPSSGPDLFWNFVLKPNLPATRYVRAVEIRCGQGSTVHHANLLIDRTGAAHRLEPTPGAGFAGMEVTIDRNPLDPESHFLFSKPGTQPYREPDGMSWILNPGDSLVLNTHLQPDGKPEHLKPQVGLYFTDVPPSRFPLLIELENDRALNIPPGARDFVVSDSLTLPADTQVLAIYPHAHLLGTLLEAFATLPTGERKWLIRIASWDADWQGVYRYTEPVFLPKGTTVSMRFHYDNSAANPKNPHTPPQLVSAGNRATDEMGHLWLQLLPVGAGDHRRPFQEALMRHRLEKDPRDFAANLNLGALFLSRLDAQGAVTLLRSAVAIDPTRPEAHDMLGSALRVLGRLPEATAQFRQALQEDPNYIDARYNLALALARSGKLDEAVDNFRVVAAAYPASPRLQSQYEELLSQKQTAAIKSEAQ